MNRNEWLRDQFTDFVGEEKTLVVFLFARTDIPEKYLSTPQQGCATLAFSHLFETPLYISDDGISQLLLFGGENVECFIPWEAVHSINDSWHSVMALLPEDLPPPKEAPPKKGNPFSVIKGGLDD